jgi:hypothetical protein
MPSDESAMKRCSTDRKGGDQLAIFRTPDFDRVREIE